MLPAGLLRDFFCACFGFDGLDPKQTKRSPEEGILFNTSEVLKTSDVLQGTNKNPKHGYHKKSTPLPGCLMQCMLCWPNRIT